MNSRKAVSERSTSESQVFVEVDLDGRGQSSVVTPIPFLSHMLEQIARHSLLDLVVRAQGDIEVDGHHVTEDVGITLGRAVLEALGDRQSIRRYGFATLPMDDARVTATLDLSGRPYFLWKVRLPKAKIGTFDVELTEVFFEALARSAQINLHMIRHSGRNLHHVVEVCFKAFARALRDAVEVDPRSPGVPSTKGTLT